jgi:hypothetical protein
MINSCQLSKSYETKVLKILVFGLCTELPVKRNTFYGTHGTRASEPEFINF